MKSSAIIFSIWCIMVLIICIMIIGYFANKSLYGKFNVSNALIVLWDIHGKRSFLNYANSHNIVYKNIQLLNTGTLIQFSATNYIVLMNQHPQEFDEIEHLLEHLSDIIKFNNIKNLLSLSTAGSGYLPIGTVVQFTKATVPDRHLYDYKFHTVKSSNIFYSTDKISTEFITNTKGFVEPLPRNQIANGQDEFVIYHVSNELNIPSLTLTGISDGGDNKSYSEGGGDMASDEMVKYLFDTFNFQ